MENTYCIGFPIFSANRILAAAFSVMGTSKQIKQNAKNIILDGLQYSKSCSLLLGFSFAEM
jgi:DNA-binding IclR family transcriptional regulator